MTRTLTRRHRPAGSASAWLASIAFLSALAVGCGGSTPAPAGDTLTGSERFGWDQPARDAGELATFHYAMYVDDVRSEAADVSCLPGQTAGRFACSARLPPMTSGSHTIQVAAFVTSAAGATLESSRSALVRVVKR